MLPSELLEDVKNHLDISWIDPASDLKIEGIIGRGMSRLNSLAGVELDYSIEDMPKALLMEYCFYARASALDEYEINYLPMLLFLQVREEVKAYEAQISILP